MENKEIIIDGVDVSGCDHFKIGTCLVDYLLTDMNFSEAKCELCTNCYYKQLKRKEQELQEAMDNYVQLDLQRVKEYNELVDLYKAKEQAETEAEKILVRRMLEDIARRLNKGKKIDWDDENQFKWYISYNNFWGIKTYSVTENKTQGTVYCLNRSFLDVAIQEIGEKRLKKYLRGE